MSMRPYSTKKQMAYLTGMEESMTVYKLLKYNNGKIYSIFHNMNGSPVLGTLEEIQLGTVEYSTAKITDGDISYEGGGHFVVELDIMERLINEYIADNNIAKEKRGTQVLIKCSINKDDVNAIGKEFHNFTCIVVSKAVLLEIVTII